MFTRSWPSPLAPHLDLLPPVSWTLHSETVPWWVDSDTRRPGGTPGPADIWNWAAFGSPAPVRANPEDIHAFLRRRKWPRRSRHVLGAALTANFGLLPCSDLTALLALYTAGFLLRAWAWWGGPPGPRRTPPSACWRPARGPAAGEGARPTWHHGRRPPVARFSTSSTVLAADPFRYRQPDVVRLYGRLDSHAWSRIQRFHVKDYKLSTRAGQERFVDLLEAT
jgi:hypothetical protein